MTPPALKIKFGPKPPFIIDRNSLDRIHQAARQVVAQPDKANLDHLEQVIAQAEQENP